MGEAASPAPGRDRAERTLWRRIPWVAIAFTAALVVLDLWSKSAVFAWLRPEDGSLPALEPCCYGHLRYPLLGEWLAFMAQTNKGAAFGRLSDWPHLLVGGRVLAVIVLGVLLVRTDRGRRWTRAALVLVLAGALGNLYDNLFLDVPNDGHPYGPVRDFIDVYFSAWSWHFPTFNVADSCITVGAVILLLSGFLDGPQEEAESSAASAGAVS